MKSANPSRWTLSRLWPKAAGQKSTPTTDLADQLDELAMIEAWVLRERGIRLLYAAAAREVIDEFNRAIGRPPDHYRGFAALGGLTGFGTSVAAAMDVLERAAEINPRNLAERFLVADYWLRRDGTKHALGLAKRARPDQRSEAIALWLRGKALAATGREARAAASYRLALWHMPPFREAREALADLLRKFGRIEEAGEHDLATLWCPPLNLVPPLPGSQPFAALKEIADKAALQATSTFGDPSISLVEEGVNGYNILHCSGVFYGVHQSLGAVSALDLAPLDSRGWLRRTTDWVLGPGLLRLRSIAGPVARLLARHLLPDQTKARLRRARQRQAMPVFIGRTVAEVKEHVAAHTPGATAPDPQAGSA